MRKFITLLAAIYCQPLFAIDIDDVQSQVFDGSCALSGCHNGSVFPNLSSVSAFGAIVNVSSNQSSKLLIAPGSISDSYLIDKIKGTGSGSRMPIGGVLSADQKALLENWVSAGALANDTPSDPDTDSDGVSDSLDNCADIANSDQLDTDSDGDGDVCDLDDDGDGVLDADDAFPLDATQSLDTEDAECGESVIGKTAVDSDLLQQRRIPFANPGSNETQQTFLRFINPNDTTTQVEMYGIDDDGIPNRSGPISFVLEAQASLQFTAQDMENGNTAKGLIGSFCDGAGKWQLIVRSDQSIEVMSLIRAPGGFLTSLNEVVPAAGDDRLVNFVNSASEPDQQTFLRIVNRESNAGTVTISAIDDSGNAGASDITLTLAANDSQQMTSQDMEAGNTSKGLTGAFGDGEGNWRLTITSTLDLDVMSLIRLPGGYLLNLSAVAPGTGNIRTLNYVEPADETLRASFLRVINTANAVATITISATDDDGATAPGGDVILTLDPLAAREVTMTDLENGNVDEGISGMLGDGNGLWRVTVTSTHTLEVMSLVETPDGFLTNMSRAAPVAGSNHEIFVFNPGSNTERRSTLRIANDGNDQASIIISGFDDAGQAGDSDVTLNLSAGQSISLSALDLENGNSELGLVGALGDGTGKWRLTVSSNASIQVQGLLDSPSGFITNLSRATEDETTETSEALTFFEANVSPILQGKCIACHQNGEVAAGTDLVYVSSSTAGHLQTNYDTLSNYIDTDAENANVILQKSRGVGHGGGKQLDIESDDYQNLVAFLGLIGGDIDANNSGSLGDFWQGVSMASQVETLRRGAIIIAKKLPSAEQIASVQAGDEDALRTALRDQMEGDGFNEFLMTGANDRLFTDAFIGGDLFLESVELSTTVFFPIGANKYFEEQPRDDDNNDPDTVSWLREWYWGMVKAALELFPHIINNDRSYQEVLTADYMMLNPRTNEILNGGLTFEADANHRSYLPGRNNGQIVRDDQLVAEFSNDLGVQVTSWGPYIDYKHAGVLSTHAFLARYPTTATNRNRARARWTYYHFLGVDIEKSAARTTDSEALADTDNPTMNNQACTVCHELHDPVAGTFQNYGNEGIYRDKQGGLDSLPASYKNPPFSDEDTEPGLYEEGDTWFADMREPGLDGQLAPNPDNSLQWLGNEIANDPRFGPATVAFWWPAVMGADPLVAPELTDAADYADKLAAFEEQSTFINDLGAEFIAGIRGGSAYNGKDLLLEMMISPWFRAKKVEAGASTVGAGATAANIGVRRLLTPRELEAKTTELLGWTWGNSRAQSDQYDGVYTTLNDQYGIYYGDIDSNGIKSRSRQLTALMANVAERQAVSMACSSVVVDFSKMDTERIIFDGIDQNITPATEFVEEFEVSASSADSTETLIATGTLSEGSKTITVAFLNDFFEEDEGDRNLVVTALRLTDSEGNILREASLANFDNIPGATATCGGADQDGYTLWSECQLSIPFTVDSSSSVRVEVDAWGQQAGPDLVAMSVAVDDDNYVGGNAAGAVAIKNKLIDMHRDFLGESLTLTSDELEASYSLFVETWQDRLSQAGNGWAWNYPDENCYFWADSHWAEDGPANQASDPDGILYTWTTILIYLMTDFYYLHE